MEEQTMVTKRNPAYTLTGRITNGQDEPLEGLIVRACDQDLITPAGPLGEEVPTDAEGRYAVSVTARDYKVGGV
jgi:hypothetical protein